MTGKLPRRLEPWLEHFAHAAERWSVDPLLIAAICDRESGGGVYLQPPGPAGTGDNGNGLGLMQIDGRYHKAWASLGVWKDPRQNILKGAEILADNLGFFGEDPDAEYLAVCGYNASRQRVRDVVLKLGNATSEARRAAADRLTTGCNYGKDVFARRERFRLEGPRA